MVRKFTMWNFIETVLRLSYSSRVALSSDVRLSCLFRMSEIMLWITIHRLSRKAQIFYRNARGAFSSRARRLAWIPSFSSHWELQGRSFISDLSVVEDQSGSYRVDGRVKQKYSREMEKSSGTEKGNTKRLGPIFGPLVLHPSSFLRSSVSVICRLLFDYPPLVLAWLSGSSHGYSRHLNDSLIGL